MKINHLTIKGRVPSKKNSRNVFVKGGKQFNIPSKQYVSWHSQATTQLSQQTKGKIRFTSVCEIQLIWYMPDLRKCDLTNKGESILDLLVDSGIITDDNWRVVPRVILECHGVDRDDPRVEIWIREIDDEQDDPRIIPEF